MKPWALAGGLAVVAALIPEAPQVPSPAQVLRQRQAVAIPVEAVWLAADRIRADRWYPDGSLVDAARQLSRNTDIDLLVVAAAAENPRLRRAAVREFGRLETVDNAEFIATFLEDEDPAVRAEAADALVQTMRERPELAPTHAVPPIEFRLLREVEPHVVEALWRALTELPTGADTAFRLERLFVNEVQQQGALHLQAARLLVDLLWNRRGRPAEAATIRALEQWFLLGALQIDGRARVGTIAIGDAELFLEGLQAAQAGSDDILRAAWRSPNGGVRRRAVEMANPMNPEHRRDLEVMARGTDDATRDVAWVRLLELPDLPVCDYLDVPANPYLSVRLVAALARQRTSVAGCGDWSAERELLAMAEALALQTGPSDWQTPSAAMEAVAPYLPEEIAELARIHAADHERWQVRAAAARVAAAVKDVDLALRLADDTHPNVRAEALTTLRRLLYPIGALAVTALADGDFHLVRTAANVLQDAPGPAQLLPPLVAAFERLSRSGIDTSREPRLALLARIREMALRSPSDGGRWRPVLAGALEDSDPVIAVEVSGLLGALGAVDARPRPVHRAALQPSEGQLRTLPSCVRVEFDHADAMEWRLDPERAPIAVARFMQQVRARAYVGQEVMYADDQSMGFGSPAPNDYMTWPRYLRDEPGGMVRRGTVVLIGFGRDTLDGRIQVVWRDQRTRDRRDTVLAHTPALGAAPADRLSRPPLPGHKITRIAECRAE